MNFGLFSRRKVKELEEKIHELYKEREELNKKVNELEEENEKLKHTILKLENLINQNLETKVRNVIEKIYACAKSSKCPENDLKALIEEFDKVQKSVHQLIFELSKARSLLNSIISLEHLLGYSKFQEIYFQKVGSKTIKIYTCSLPLGVHRFIKEMEKENIVSIVCYEANSNVYIYFPDYMRSRIEGILNRGLQGYKIRYVKENNSRASSAKIMSDDTNKKISCDKVIEIIIEDLRSYGFIHSIS